MPSPEDVRTEVKAWLEENWNPDLTVGEWWDILARSGYAAPTFPEDTWGKGYPRDLANVVNEAITEHGAIGPPAGLGYLLTAPTIVAHGNDRQKREDLLRILNGQDAWCQLFSEPGAGSDLASLSTKAVKDGDEWIITGQKVWTSTAQLCNLGMLIARTAPDLPKHKGITYFKFDMQQKGVEIRPLREMTGRALFNEVFMDGARVHEDDIIGGLNNGWAVTNTTLMAERAGLGTGGSGAAGNAFPGPIAAQLDDRAGDHVGQVRTGGTGGGGIGAANRLMKLAQELGNNTDPNIRQKLAQLYTLQQIGRFSSLRAKSPESAHGRRAEHRQADDERPAPPAARGRPRDHRPARHGDGHRHARRRDGARGDVVLAGSVDLRRHRPGAAQHHRRTRARAAEGTRTGEGHSVQGAPRQQLVADEDCHA